VEWRASERLALQNDKLTSPSLLLVIRIYLSFMTQSANNWHKVRKFALRFNHDDLRMSDASDKMAGRTMILPQDLNPLAGPVEGDSLGL
jgi:hypothetical protein